MQINDLLLAAKLVTCAEIDQALALQQKRGGRLSDNLLAALPEKAALLRDFVARMPPEPRDLAETGIPAIDLLNLLIKQIYLSQLETPSQFIDAIKLPPNLVNELVRMAVSRNLLAALGDIGGMMRYELSELGRRWAQDAMQSWRYTGPAPVTLEAFCHRVRLQRVNNDLVTFESIHRALDGYDISEQFIRKIGPALNSGQPLLMYGPPGNGKTTVALSFAKVFSAVIYLPYAVMIEGQIMRVFDPSLHSALAPPPSGQRGGNFTSLQREASDARWVTMTPPLRLHRRRADAGNARPSLRRRLRLLRGPATHQGAGRHASSSTISAASSCPPPRCSTAGSCPLDNRVDYLKLHTGMSFALPFEALADLFHQSRPRRSDGWRLPAPPALQDRGRRAGPPELSRHFRLALPPCQYRVQ